MDAKEVNRKRVMKALITTRRLRFLGIPYFEYRGEAVETVRRVRLPAFNVGLFGFEVGYLERTYAAPIESRDFEARMRADIPALKALIKEVILGSRTAS
jgi:hypothetical protein